MSGQASRSRKEKSICVFWSLRDVGSRLNTAQRPPMTVGIKSKVLSQYMRPKGHLNITFFTDHIYHCLLPYCAPTTLCSFLPFKTHQAHSCPRAFASAVLSAWNALNPDLSMGGSLSFSCVSRGVTSSVRISLSPNLKKSPPLSQHSLFDFLHLIHHHVKAPYLLFVHLLIIFGYIPTPTVSYLLSE